jgi:DNA-binding NarL/FixJ family response regulator
LDLHDPSEPAPDARSASTATDGLEPFGLTDRESEVIGLVAAGWSNQQIADALFITRKTASVHVSNILGKFGVRNRGEAAAVAHRLGVPSDVPDQAGPAPSSRPLVP